MSRTKRTFDELGLPHKSRYMEAVLKFIDAYWAEHHEPPATRDVMKAVGMNSTSHIGWVMKQIPDVMLTDKGCAVPKWVQEAIDEAWRKRNEKETAVPG